MNNHVCSIVATLTFEAVDDLNSIVKCEDGIFKVQLGGWPDLMSKLTSMVTAHTSASTRTQIDALRKEIYTTATELIEEWNANTGDTLDSTILANQYAVVNHILSWAKDPKLNDLDEVLASYKSKGDNIRKDFTIRIPVVFTFFLNWLKIGIKFETAMSVLNGQAMFINYGDRIRNPDGKLGALNVQPKWMWGNSDFSSYMDSPTVELSLQSDSAVEITVTISKSHSNSFTVDVNGRGAFEIPFINWFAGIGGSSGNYSYSNQMSTGSKVTVKMTWKGITPISGLKFQPYTSQSGWFEPSYIIEAIKTTGQDTDTVQFLDSKTQSNYNFGKDGDFGRISGLLLSQRPCIEITYEGSNSEDVSRSWDNENSTHLSFFGLFTIDVGSKESYSDKQSSSTTMGFKFTYNPKPVQEVNELQKSAFVLGVAVDWPFATKLQGTASPKYSLFSRIKEKNASIILPKLTVPSGYLCVPQSQLTTIELECDQFRESFFGSPHIPENSFVEVNGTFTVPVFTEEGAKVQKILVVKVRKIPEKEKAKYLLNLISINDEFEMQCKNWANYQTTRYTFSSKNVSDLASATDFLTLFCNNILYFSQVVMGQKIEDCINFVIQWIVKSDQKLQILQFLDKTFDFAKLIQSVGVENQTFPSLFKTGTENAPEIVHQILTLAIEGSLPYIITPKMKFSDFFNAIVPSSTSKQLGENILSGQLRSVHGAVTDFKSGTNFANVIGSTLDPLEKGMGTWINMWKSITGVASPVCTANDSSCKGDVLVGAHVILGTRSIVC